MSVMLQIGPITVDPPLILAPMAGVTDRDFRLIMRRIGGVGLVSMEFVSSRALVGGHRQATDVMHFSQEERPVAIQIYGSQPETMAEAARIVEEVGADVCDINMGCPANKVLKGCAGAALMRDIDLAERIIAAVRRTISIPLTVKFRLGFNDQQKNFLELGRVCEANGVQAVSMHGRTAKQMFRGEADWSEIARLKEELSIPVIGNGGRARARRCAPDAGSDGLRRGHDRPWGDQKPLDIPTSSGPDVRWPLAGAHPRGPTRPHPRSFPHGGGARSGQARAAQAAQVHRLVHPRPSAWPQATPADQSAARCG